MGASPAEEAPPALPPHRACVIHERHMNISLPWEAFHEDSPNKTKPRSPGTEAMVGSTVEASKVMKHASSFQSEPAAFHGGSPDTYPLPHYPWTYPLQRRPRPRCRPIVGWSLRVGPVGREGDLRGGEGRQRRRQSRCHTRRHARRRRRRCAAQPEHGDEEEARRVEHPSCCRGRRRLRRGYGSSR